jgi:hypothetical protein
MKTDVRLREFPYPPRVEELDVKCFYCRSSRLRLSRIRLSDLPRFLLLQTPVRCRSCHERSYLNMFKAWNLRFAEKTARRRPQHGKKDDGESAAVSRT